ncbi:MAG: biotin/lipoyl-containing protein [Deltaproteobacteria bacterium]|nr:biotin/lipoyl-containing protein [Deltaproteobacteria bacterium]
MKYFVDVAGRERVVELTTRPDGSVNATVDGKPVQVESQSFAQRELCVHVDGAVFDLTLEGSPPVLGVVGAGQRTYVKVESERLRAAAKATGASGGGRERDVRSPMPGRIVKMLVEVGDEVGPGQSVAVVEAMKMENDVRAKKGGRVSRVAVSAGATVEANAVLIAFE